MTELNTMSVHALSEQVEELEQELQDLHNRNYTALLVEARNAWLLEFEQQTNNYKQQLAAKDAVLSEMTGMFAQDGVDICEPVEGFAKRPQDLLRCVQQLIVKMVEAQANEAFWKGSTYTHDLNEQKLAAELDRVRSAANPLVTTADLLLNQYGAGIPSELFGALDKQVRTLKTALASPAAEPVVPEALCWVLWYHQGANSPIGQSIRQVLGMTRFQRMSDKQVEAAKAWAAENPWLQQAQPAPATEPVTPDTQDAARWRALLSIARIRPLGSAGLMKPDANNYAHLGLELWTVFGRDYSAELLEQLDHENELGREWLIKFADIAIAAQGLQPAPVAQSDDHIHIGCEAGLCDVCNEQSQEGEQV